MANTRTLHRSISERWVIIGTLVLESPAHFGNGDADPLTDMPLLTDEASGRPLLPGTSIAGALRNYLRERALGYGQAEKSDTIASALFGGYREDENGAQSSLIVFDAVSEASGFELRDGVAIDPETRTAADQKKFDLELLAAGTTFPLRFELQVGDGADGQQLRNILGTALSGLENGEITLGARKRRGFGQMTVKGWQIWKYDLKSKKGLLACLSSERDWKKAYPEQAGASLTEKLGATLLSENERKQARLSATFALDGTLMIRSGFGASDSGPDMVHLHAARLDGTPQPVIPGTSWAGVLRGRALKIARTVSGDKQKLARAFVDGMFGPSEIKPGQKDVRASRVSIKESKIEKVDSLVVTRVKIDRFTGGAFESALFTEQPAVGKPETRVTLDLTLRNPQRAEIGLLLLLLKDLWTGDLPIGGESGIGRGRLKGISATLNAPQGQWTLTAKDEKLEIVPDAEKLEEFVSAFNQEIKKAQVEA